MANYCCSCAILKFVYDIDSRLNLVGKTFWNNKYWRSNRLFYKSRLLLFLKHKNTSIIVWKVSHVEIYSQSLIILKRSWHKARILLRQSYGHPKPSWMPIKLWKKNVFRTILLWQFLRSWVWIKIWWTKIWS